jgi:integrase
MADTSTTHIWTPTIGGKRYAYYRRDGRTVRIRDAAGTPLLPEHPNFQTAYAKAEAAWASGVRKPATAPSKPEPQPYSLTRLISLYRASDHWRDLSPITHAAYLYRFGILEAAWGELNAATLDRVNVLAMRRILVAKEDLPPRKDGKPHERAPSRGNVGVAGLNVLLQHAVNLGWRKDNPAGGKGLGKLRTGDGYATWKPADYETFMAGAAPVQVKAAVALGYWTGLRISDAVKLPRVARQDGSISFTPQKTARKRNPPTVSVPEHPELTRWLDAAPAHAAPTLLANLHGRPWSKDRLTHSLVKAVREAGLDGLTFHGLRKSLASRLAEAGAADSVIEAVIPHSAAMTRLYRREANARLLAKQAMALLDGK